MRPSRIPEQAQEEYPGWLGSVPGHAVGQARLLDGVKPSCGEYFTCENLDCREHYDLSCIASVH
jgi:hypothetical protein